MPEKDHDTWITFLLHFLRIGITTFCGKCELAAVAKVSQEGGADIVYDPDALLAALGFDFMVSVDDSRFVDASIVVSETNDAFDPQRLRLYAKVPHYLNVHEIIEIWLQNAASIFHNNFRNRSITTQAVALSFAGLRYWAPNAISQVIQSSSADDADRDRITSAIQAIALISRTVEEGHLPKGKILFRASKEAIDVDRFQPVPLLNSKHSGKLLALTRHEGYLISDGVFIIGISRSSSNFYLLADFKRGRVTLSTSTAAICVVVAGEFKCLPTSPDLILKKLAAEDVRVELGLSTAAEIAEMANEHAFGCTLVVDPSENVIEISGHTLDKPIGKAQLNLLSGMASVDGAIVINTHGEVTSFGCLLDGASLGSSEVRARGARYNSALRFSAKAGNEQLRIIVVSADGPMSVFCKGVEVYSDSFTGLSAPATLPQSPLEGVKLDAFESKAEIESS